MVLAERTAKIAAKAARRQDHAPGKEPEQRFFFDGIQRERCDPPVIIRFHTAVSRDPSTAKSNLSFRDITVSEAYSAFRHAGLLSVMPYNFEPLQVVRLILADSAFLARDADLILYGVHSVQIRKQKSPFLTAADDDAIAFHVKIVR